MHGSCVRSRFVRLSRRLASLHYLSGQHFRFTSLAREERQQPFFAAFFAAFFSFCFVGLEGVVSPSLSFSTAATALCRPVPPTKAAPGTRIFSGGSDRRYRLSKSFCLLQRRAYVSKSYQLSTNLSTIAFLYSGRMFRYAVSTRCLSDGGRLNLDTI